MKIGIVGAGLAGRLVAYYLQKHSVELTLFETGSAMGELSVGMVAAGMVAPYSEYDLPTKDLFEIGLDSLELWKAIAMELSVPFLYQQPGSLTIAFSQDRGELTHLARRLEEVLDSVSLLDINGVQKYEPEIIRPDIQGLFLEKEGHVNVPEFYFHSQKALDTQRWIVNDPVDSMMPNKITTKNQSYSFDWVIDCRGLGANDFFPNLRGVRGELIYLHAPEVNITRPIRFLHPRYPIYLVPRPNNHFVIGASSVETEDLSPISVKSTLELLTAVYSLHSGFSESRIIETRVGLRPAFVDNKPQIHYQPGIIRMNGLYRNGYLMAPGLMKEIVDVIHFGVDKIKRKHIWTVTA